MAAACSSEWHVIRVADSCIDNIAIKHR